MNNVNVSCQQNVSQHYYVLDTLASYILSSVAAVVSCFCFIIVAAVIVLGLGALFLLFVLLNSQRVASHSCETLRELLHLWSQDCK